MTGGYDDESVIPRSLLKELLDEFERQLKATSNPEDLLQQVQRLKETASELGHEYSELMDKLIEDYTAFKKTPEHDLLEQLFSDIKSLQLLLTV